jgi:hypothetical protein
MGLVASFGNASRAPTIPRPAKQRHRGNGVEAQPSTIEEANDAKDALGYVGDGGNSFGNPERGG